MSFRQSDPDSTIQFFREIEDRFRRIEARLSDQPSLSTKEVRIKSAKKISSMVVIGDLLSQSGRCNEFIDDSWVVGGEQLYRWQEQVADNLGGTSGAKHILPTSIGPFSGSALIGTPVQEVVGTGAFVHWDYTVPGASAIGWAETIQGIYAPPKVEVDLLCIMLGSADYLYAVTPDTYIDDIPVDEFIGGYANIISDYPAKNVCCIIPWDVSADEATSMPIPWQNYVDSISSLASTNISVIHPIEAVDGTLVSGDWSLLTQAGHNLIATSVLEAVGSMDKGTVSSVGITASSSGAVIDGYLVLGNWQVGMAESGALVATNMLTHQVEIIAQS
jgi:hypothetical protein